MSIEASDDYAGFGPRSSFGNGSFRLNAVEGSFVTGTGSLRFEQGSDPLNPTFTFDLNFPQYVSDGAYEIQLFLYDLLGNSVFLQSPDLAASGQPSSITVISDEDDEAPVLTGLTLSQSVVDVTNGPQTITVTIDATDNLAGFGSGSTGSGSFFISGIGSRGSLPIVSGTATAPTFAFDITVADTVAPGEYDLRLSLIDNVFNDVFLRADDLDSLGFVSSLVVTNDDFMS